MTKEQGAGAAEGEAVAGVVPVGLQQKVAVKQGDLRVIGEQSLIDAEVEGAAIPSLLGQLAQMLIGEVQMDKRQWPANVPGGGVLSR